MRCKDCLLHDDAHWECRADRGPVAHVDAECRCDELRLQMLLEQLVGHEIGVEVVPPVMEFLRCALAAEWG